MKMRFEDNQPGGKELPDLIPEELAKELSLKIKLRIVDKVILEEIIDVCLNGFSDAEILEPFRLMPMMAIAKFNLSCDTQSLVELQEIWRKHVGNYVSYICSNQHRINYRYLDSMLKQKKDQLLIQTVNEWFTSKYSFGNADEPGLVNDELIEVLRKVKTEDGKSFAVMVDMIQMYNNVIADPKHQYYEYRKSLRQHLFCYFSLDWDKATVTDTVQQLIVQAIGNTLVVQTH